MTKIGLDFKWRGSRVAKAVGDFERELRGPRNQNLVENDVGCQIKTQTTIRAGF